MTLQEPKTAEPKAPVPKTPAEKAPGEKVPAEKAPAEKAQPAQQLEVPAGEPKAKGDETKTAPEKKAGMGGTIAKKGDEKDAENSTGTMGTEDSGMWTYIWLGLLAALIVFLWRRGHLARLKKHIGETREQLKKCTWPTRDELKQHTIVVLMSTLLLAAFIMVSDLIVQFAVWDLLLGSGSK